MNWPAPSERYKDARRGLQLSLTAPVSFLSLQEESEGQPSKTEKDDAAEENFQIIFRFEINYPVRVEEVETKFGILYPIQS